MSIEVDVYFAGNDPSRWSLHMSLAALLTAEMRPNAGEQFFDTEGLYHVIISADAEALHLVGVTLLRTEEEDGDVQALAQRAADRKAVTFGQHDIQDDQVRAM